MHIVAQPRPIDQRIPRRGLPRDQILGRIGAVTEQVALGVRGEPLREQCRVGRDPVDRGVGEARQRHRARVDLALDRAPFIGDRLGQRIARQGERHAAGGAHGLAVEKDGAGVVEGDVGPETLHARSPRAGTRRFKPLRDVTRARRPPPRRRRAAVPPRARAASAVTATLRAATAIARRRFPPRSSSRSGSAPRMRRSAADS